MNAQDRLVLEYLKHLVAELESGQLSVARFKGVDEQRLKFAVQFVAGDKAVQDVLTRASGLPVVTPQAKQAGPQSTIAIDPDGPCPRCQQRALRTIERDGGVDLLCVACQHRVSSAG